MIDNIKETCYYTYVDQSVAPASVTPPCKNLGFFLYSHAGMVELVDSVDLGSSAVRRAGSSPVTRTKRPEGTNVSSGLLIFKASEYSVTSEISAALHKLHEQSAQLHSLLRRAEPPPAFWPS